MYHNLNDILNRAVGGEILTPEQLSKMTALELMELLAPNDVRFCVKEKEVPKHTRKDHANIGAPGSKELVIEHHPEIASFNLSSEMEILVTITYGEMDLLIAFVKRESK